MGARARRARRTAAAIAAPSPAVRRARRLSWTRMANDSVPRTAAAIAAPSPAVRRARRVSRTRMANDGVPRTAAAIAAPAGAVVTNWTHSITTNLVVRAALNTLAASDLEPTVSQLVSTAPTKIKTKSHFYMMTAPDIISEQEIGFGRQAEAIIRRERSGALSRKDKGPGNTLVALRSGEGDKLLTGLACDEAVAKLVEEANRASNVDLEAAGRVRDLLGEPRGCELAARARRTSAARARRTSAAIAAPSPAVRRARRWPPSPAVRRARRVSRTRMANDGVSRTRRRRWRGARRRRGRGSCSRASLQARAEHQWTGRHLKSLNLVR